MSARGLRYKYPPISFETKANFESFISEAPINGSVFQSDQNKIILFNIASNSHFIHTMQSFLCGNITAHAANGAIVKDAAMRTSNQGISACFSRIVIRFAGTVVETIDEYNTLCTLYY